MSKEHYHHGDLKAALIEAGLQILQESGLSKLSLRNCTERTNVSYTAPKNHFGNMTGLMTAIAAQGYDQLTDYIQKSLAPHINNKESTRRETQNAAFQGYLDFASENAALFELMFSHHKINDQDPVLIEPKQRFHALLYKTNTGLDWDPEQSADSATRAQMMHWSLVHGFAHLTITGHFTKEMIEGANIMDFLALSPLTDNECNFKSIK